MRLPLGAPPLMNLMANSTKQTPLSSVSINLPELIQNNSEFLVDSSAKVKLVSRLDRSGAWTCHVVKTEHGKRTPFLSATASTLQDALEELVRKSSLAIDQHVSTNGYDLPPRISTRTVTAVSRRRGGERSPSVDDASTPDLEQSEIICIAGDLSTSGTETETSDSEVDSDVGASTKHLDRRRRSFRGAAHLSSKYHDGHHPHRHTFASSRLPPPPPAGVRPLGPALAARATHIGVGAASHRPPFSLPPPPPPLPPAAVRHLVMPPPPPPPARPLDQLTPPWAKLPHPKTYSMMLRIRWVGQGQLNVLERCALSVSEIRVCALHNARIRAAEFKQEGTLDAMAKFPSSPMRAEIKTIRVGNETYEMASFGDDLSVLIADSDDASQCLRVDVEISSLRSPPPPWPLRPTGCADVQQAIA